MAEKTTRFSTVEEVAQTLRVSKQTVRRMITDGDLPAIKYRHILRIPTADVWEFISEHRYVPGSKDVAL